MASNTDLARQLERMDGAPFPAYKDLRGSYEFPGFLLRIEHVQGDPFAAPSRLSIEIAHEASGLPEDLYQNASRKAGVEHGLAEAFASACTHSGENAGSGKSGLLAIDRPGQEMLRRSCITIDGGKTVARFVAGLPANGRRILGKTAARLLTGQLPEVVKKALVLDQRKIERLRTFADTAEDGDQLRGQLEQLGLVAFVADGAVLPRVSGVDERPLPGAVPFQAPESLRQTVRLPHAGEIRGMGVPEGVTLIVGGGYHGKSTLLNAMERGIYNHRPEDGRERVVTRRDAVKIRAEDGRSVAGVDLSSFINNLPGGKSTTAFSSENASGSTSQAANIVEALETGSRSLLLDEDISATNFLIRDSRMQRLVAPDKEPITPLVQGVRSLWEDQGVSTILVLGGSGDYFEVADRILGMDHYEPRELTAEARAIVEEDGGPRIASAPVVVPSQPRVPVPGCLRPYGKKAERGGGPKGNRKDTRPPKARVRAHETRGLTFGEEEIDLSLVAQILDPSQVRMLGALLLFGFENGLFDGRTPVPEVARTLVAEMDRRGLARMGSGDLAEVRAHDVAAALNRVRGLRLV